MVAFPFLARRRLRKLRKRPRRRLRRRLRLAVIVTQGLTQAVKAVKRRRSENPSGWKKLKVSQAIGKFAKTFHLKFKKS